MAVSSGCINQLILDQLATGEKRILALVVAVRKSLDRSTPVKGDLTALVKAGVRRLLLSKAIVEHEGLYSLSQTAPLTAATTSSS